MPAELLKIDTEPLTKVLCKLCNKIVVTGQWLMDWVRLVVVPIPKLTETT